MQRLFYNPLELLEKAKYDYSRFEYSGSSNDRNAIFDVFNDLNCLFDWFIGSETDIDNKISCFKTFNPYESTDDVKIKFKKYYNKTDGFPEKNISQFVIRNICNFNKHYKIKDVAFAMQNAFYPGDNIFPGETDSLLAIGKITFIVVNENNNETYQVDELIQNSIKQWEVFFYH
jgi:hypothetical protein